MVKKKIHKLNYSFESDFKLIGIASHENDYRLSWAMNTSLGIQLMKANDLVLVHPKHKIELNYSKYTFEDDINYRNFCLISNKSEMGFLLPEIKNIDFILKISGEFDMELIDKIIASLKKVDIVLAAFLIDKLPEKMSKIFVF